MVGLSERTSWRVKGRYVAKSINNPSNFDKPSSIGTKEIPNELMKASSVSSTTTEAYKEKPKSRANIHKNQEQLAEPKRQRNKRYKKNLNERKQFSQSQNPNYVHSKKATNLKVNEKSRVTSHSCNHCQSCS